MKMDRRLKYRAGFILGAGHLPTILSTGQGGPRGLAWKGPPDPVLPGYRRAASAMRKALHWQATSPGY